MSTEATCNSSPGERETERDRERERQREKERERNLAYIKGLNLDQWTEFTKQVGFS